jgi:hypothetical protein
MCTGCSQERADLNIYVQYIGHVLSGNSSFLVPSELVSQDKKETAYPQKEIVSGDLIFFWIRGSLEGGFYI